MFTKIINADTYDQRLERLQSYFDHVPTFISRGKYSNKDPRNNIVIVRSRPEGRNTVVKQWTFGHNLVTNDGDIFYATKAVGGTPAANENFMAGRMELQNPGSAPTPAKADTYTSFATTIAASRKALDATYPKINDGDTDNTGAAVDAASYRVSWTNEFSGTGINGGCIHDNASPVGATKLLTHWVMTAFTKNTNDSLKVFVNHVMNGV